VATDAWSFTSTVVGLDGVLANLQRTGAALKDRRTPNRAAAAQLYQFVIKNFETEGGMTEGGRWKELAPSTVLARYRKSAGAKRRATVKAGLRLGLSGSDIGGLSGLVFRILQDTGHLRQSFEPFSDEDEAGVGARASFGVNYATVHEEGSEDGRIPQRKMLPSEAQALEIGVRVYGFYVERAILGASA